MVLPLIECIVLRRTAKDICGLERMLVCRLLMALLLRISIIARTSRRTKFSKFMRTRNSVYGFYPKTGKSRFYYDDVLHTSKNVSGLAKLQINSDLTSFCERENGDIVFSSLATGIYLLDSNFNATHYNIASVYRVWENSKNELLALAFNGIYHLKSDGQMNLVEAFKREGHYARTFVDGDTCYIALGDQLFRYTDKIEYLRSVPNGAETTFIDKHNGRFVIGTRTGVYLNYSLSSAQTHQPLFEESVISAALYDREGNLWVSTLEMGCIFHLLQM